MRHLFICALLLFNSAAHAFCIEPSPRSASTFVTVPSAPYCLSGYKFGGNHSCTRIDLDNYKRQVEQYMDAMREYAGEAQRLAKRYVEEAAEYAICQSNLAVKEYNSAFK